MIIHFDGACAPENPGGHAAWGFHAEDSDLRVRRFGYIGKDSSTTNNQAEWTALIEALKWSRTIVARDVEFVGDSALVINQINRKWQCRDARMFAFCQEAEALISPGVLTSFSWMSRDHNKADVLSRFGLALGMMETEEFLPYECYQVFDDIHKDHGTVRLERRDHPPAVVSWSPSRKASCNCEYWKKHVNMGMCVHMAALFFAHRLSSRPVRIGPRYGELVEKS